MNDFDDGIFPIYTRDLMPPSQKNLQGDQILDTESYVPKTQSRCGDIVTTLLKYLYLYKNNLGNFKQSNVECGRMR